MTTADIAREAVAELRAIDLDTRAKMVGPLAVLENLPETVASPPFVLGTTEPVAGVNVGPAVLGPITKVVKGTNGVAKILTDSPIYDTRFECQVIAETPLPHLVNCETQDSAGVTDRPAIKHAANVVLAQYDYCGMSARTFGDEADGIVGQRYILNQCHLHDLDDGFGVHGPAADVIVLGSLIERLVWQQEAQHADGTHNDGAQVHNGGRLAMIGSKIDAYRPDGKPAMSCMMFSPAPVSGGYLELLLAHNWFNGGQVALNFGRWITPTGTRRIVGNRWGADVTTPVLAKRDLPLQIAGNTQGGQPRNDRRNG